MNKLRSVIFLGCILLFPFLLGCNKVADPSEMEDIILWLDAASISGLGDGDSVEVWNDLSGNRNDAVAVEPGAGPTYIESFHNGLAALGFNGIDDILVVAHNDQLNFGFDSFTIAVVYQRNINDVSNLRLFAKGGNQDRQPGYGVDGGNDSLVLRVGNGKRRLSERMANKPRETMNIATFVFDRTSMDSFSGAVENSLDLYIGGLKPNYLLWDGAIAEIIIIRRALLAPELLELKTHLADKWNTEGALPSTSNSSLLFRLLVLTLVVIAGTLSIVFLFEWRRSRSLRVSYRHLTVHGKNLSLIFASMAVTLGAVELVLVLAGWERYDASQVKMASWWVCNDGYCHFDGKAIEKLRVMETLGGGDYKGWLITTNNQGFHDEDDFTADPENSNSYKVLVLGDSFTWGSSASPGKSYVDIMEARLQRKSNVLVWNLGIPATGTKQAVNLAREFIPIMEPDLVVLGFYRNDFGDNLYPIDQLFRTESGKAIVQYWLDKEFNPHLLDPVTAYNRAYGLPAIEYQSIIGRLLISTRLGTMVHKVLPGLFAERTVESPWANKQPTQNALAKRGIEVTKQLLLELQQLVEESDASLIVLHIPHRKDLVEETLDYTSARAIFQDLQIDVVSVLQQLKEADYREPPNDHWNNFGHAKAADAMTEYILNLMER